MNMPYFSNLFMDLSNMNISARYFFYLIPCFFFLLPLFASSVSASNKEIERAYRARKAAEKKAAKEAGAAKIQKAVKVQEPAPVQKQTKTAPAPEPAKIQEPAPLPTTCTLKEFLQHYAG